MPGAKFMVVGETGSPALNILNDGTMPMNPALRVNDNGRVGIGTTAPGARFMVVGEAGAPTMNIVAPAGNAPALRVNEDGKVGIGTTAPTEALEVNGNVKADNVMVPSDRRYKTNIATLSNSLALVSQLRGTEYFMRDVSKSQDVQIGFIAQEIEEVFPSLVKTDKKGYKSVNYIAVIPVLTEAIKEQQETIDELKKDMAELKAMIQRRE